MLDGPWSTNRKRKIMTLASWALKVSHSIRMRKMFRTSNPAMVLLVCLPFSNLRPMKEFQLRRCCGRPLFVSCTSRKLEQMFVIHIRIIHRLKLILNLVDLRQKMRPETFQDSIPRSCVQQTRFVCHVLFGSYNTPIMPIFWYKLCSTV